MQQQPSFPPFYRSELLQTHTPIHMYVRLDIGKYVCVCVFPRGVDSFTPKSACSEFIKQKLLSANARLSTKRIFASIVVVRRAPCDFFLLTFHADFLALLTFCIIIIIYFFCNF